LRGRLGLALRRDLTLANLADRLGEVHREQPAFLLAARSRVAGGAAVSFADAARAVARLSTALGRAGVRHGEAVALVPSNGCDYLLALLAVVRAGGVAVPINPVLKAAEVRALVQLSGSKTLITDAVTMRRAVGPKRALSEVERWLSLGSSPGATDLVALARRIRAPDPAMPVAADTVVAIMYTSGTTGRPKGARLTNDGLLALLSAAALQPTGLPGTVRRAVTALPVAHIMGLATSLGIAMAGIANRMLERFDPSEVLDWIERDRAELFVGVPAMYHAMLEAGAEKRDLSSVKAWASAADVMPRELARRFQSLGRLAGPIPALFVEAYGMVELGGAAMAKVIPPGPNLLSTRLAGVPLFGYKVKVVDARGRRVPRGRAGELCVKGPGVLESYHDDPVSTGRALEGGWLRTGDVARIGPLGTVFFEGRAKDVIKVGGYSVFPAEVEEEIRRHPKVSDVAVLGVPDPGKGSVPVAAVVPVAGRRLTVGELRTWAKRSLASYRRPRRWLVVRSLPRGSTRKVDKRKLARMFEGAAARGTASSTVSPGRRRASSI
jgi:acyl-CoA synthetase (AMP-forming)/AMP-acid ligase II